MMLRALIMAHFFSAVLPGHASGQEGKVVSGPAAVAIAAWVSEATGLPMPGNMPEIRLAAAKDMPRLMGAAEPSSTSAGFPDIIAFYNTESRTIYLPNDWTGSTPSELSVLVHEMVHHAQAEAGRRFACPAERERQAFDAQTRWLALFSSDLSQEFGINRMFLLVATTCGMP